MRNSDPGNHPAGKLQKDRVENNNTEIQIETGNGHSLILKADNTLWATGENFSGQLAMVEYR